MGKVTSYNQPLFLHCSVSSPPVLLAWMMHLPGARCHGEFAFFLQMFDNCYFCLRYLHAIVTAY
jgi:hypothetical protein